MLQTDDCITMWLILFDELNLTYKTTCFTRLLWLCKRGGLIKQRVMCISVSGTTEKIFETKTHLYDVYVDNQNVTTHIPALRELLRVSDADRDKYIKLNNQRQVFFDNNINSNAVLDVCTGTRKYP